MEDKAIPMPRRWLVLCRDDEMWERCSSREEAELEKASAQVGCECGGPHRMVLEKSKPAEGPGSP